jgi:hypothetical protein
MTGEAVSSKREIVFVSASACSARSSSWEIVPSANAAMPSMRVLGLGILPMGSVGIIGVSWLGSIRIGRARTITALVGPRWKGTS